MSFILAVAAPLRGVKSLACLVSLLGWVSVGLSADDLRYESDNQARTVRPPVLSELAPFPVPFRVQFSDIENQPRFPAANPRRLVQHQGRDALVLGKVESIFVPAGRNKVVLNFGRDHRTCFAAVIDIRDFFKWGTSDPDQIAKIYDGQNMAVDGLVTLYREQPQISVTLPHQLRIITSR